MKKLDSDSFKRIMSDSEEYEPNDEKESRAVKRAPSKSSTARRKAGSEMKEAKTKTTTKRTPKPKGEKKVKHEEKKETKREKKAKNEVEDDDWTVAVDAVFFCLSSLLLSLQCPKWCLCGGGGERKKKAPKKKIVAGEKKIVDRYRKMVLIGEREKRRLV